MVANGDDSLGDPNGLKEPEVEANVAKGEAELLEIGPNFVELANSVPVEAPPKMDCAPAAVAKGD